MTTAFLTYSAFVEMFEPSQDFSGYEDDGGIEIQWETVKCKNPARENGGWCAFLWKPSSEVYTGKWIRQEYNGSSPFAMWWCEQSNDDEQDGWCEEHEQVMYKDGLKCSGCLEEEKNDEEDDDVCGCGKCRRCLADDTCAGQCGDQGTITVTNKNGRKFLVCKDCCDWFKRDTKEFKE